MPARLDKAFMDFHKNLRKHNERPWFQAHKDTYELKVKGPMLSFIASLQPGMKKISRHIVIDPRPTGGSLFRIYRDTRFSKDKSPYKTHTAAHFSHQKGEFSAPGFYLHLEPGQSFFGAGIWHPDTATANKIRDAIVEDPKGWKRATKGLKLGGDSLKRPPKGFAPEHELIEDLKRKDFIVSIDFSDTQVTAPTFQKTVLTASAKASPFVAFLANAVGLPW